MGIAQLLPQLRSITKRRHISHYTGKTVAIDGYVLLHRGAYACARELVEGQPTDKYVTYCLGRIDMLRRHGVTPFVVFDGGPLPNKSEEENCRARSREDHRNRAQFLWSQGNRVAALDAYQKAVDVTPEMAHAVYTVLKSQGIRFLVAPYEADAQLAYLALNNFVDAVLTEDSDLLAYGCPLVLFKMDWDGGLDEIAFSDLVYCKELNFTGWTLDLFQQCCVMAGCDFLKSLPGIGIKKAHAHLRRTRDFMRALRLMRFDGVAIPRGYEVKFQRALWVFRHQRCYCTRRREIVNLKEITQGDLKLGAAVPEAADLNEGEVDFLGPALPVHVAQGIAEGRLHPVTHLPFVNLLLPPVRSGGVEEKALGRWSMATANNTQLMASTGHASGGSGIDEGAKMHRSSEEVRKEFKRPRVARDDGGAPVAGKKAIMAVKKWFGGGDSCDNGGASGVGGGNEGANGIDQEASIGREHSLRSTLQAALLAAQHRVGGGDESNNSKGNEMPQISPHPQANTTKTTKTPVVVAPLWRPQQCWRTPGDNPLPKPHSTDMKTTERATINTNGCRELNMSPGFYALMDDDTPAAAVDGDSDDGNDEKRGREDHNADKTAEEGGKRWDGMRSLGTKVVVDLSHVAAAKEQAELAVEKVVVVMANSNKTASAKGHTTMTAAGSGGGSGSGDAMKKPLSLSAFDKFAFVHSHRGGGGGGERKG